MDSALNIFLLELAAIFPVVNPPGSALVFLGLTGHATHEVRRLLAWRVARNAFFVLVGSLSLGALVLQFYGISIPILRVAGGIIVAAAGWKLLSEGSRKELEATADSGQLTDPLDQAFYPLTLPLTTGPGSIAVVISLGLSRGSYTSSTDEAVFVLASLCAVAAIAAAIFVCFAYADRVQRLLGPGGTDIAVRLSAFILFCLGIQILWSGGSELLQSVMHPAPPVASP
jgi:multiple antibiotic resistance protein